MQPPSCTLLTPAGQDSDAALDEELEEEGGEGSGAEDEDDELAAFIRLQAGEEDHEQEASEMASDKAARRAARRHAAAEAEDEALGGGLAADTQRVLRGERGCGQHRM